MFIITRINVFRVTFFYIDSLPLLQPHLLIPNAVPRKIISSARRKRGLLVLFYDFTQHESALSVWNKKELVDLIHLLSKNYFPHRACMTSAPIVPCSIFTGFCGSSLESKGMPVPVYTVVFNSVHVLSGRLISTW